MSKLTPETLFAFANEYARAAEAAGQGTQYPTIRAAARKFRVTQQDIEDTCGDYIGKGYMGIVAGARTGAGVYSYKGGDRQIEAYKGSEQ